MTDSTAAPSSVPAAPSGNQPAQSGAQASTRDPIRRAQLVNRTALEAVRGLLQTPTACPERCGVTGWPVRLGVALAEECLSLEVVHRCLAQQRAALDDPALSGLADSIQALERTVLTLREVGRKKLMLATLVEANQRNSGVPDGPRSDSTPIMVLGDAVRREALALARRLDEQQGVLDRAIETRAALVQQVFSG